MKLITIKTGILERVQSLLGHLTVPKDTYHRCVRIRRHIFSPSKKLSISRNILLLCLLIGYTASLLEAIPGRRHTDLYIHTLHATVLGKVTGLVNVWYEVDRKVSKAQSFSRCPLEITQGFSPPLF